MFEAASMLYIYVETPLHAGTGRGLGAIDLPIQRERITGYPIVQASSIKGRLRSSFYLSQDYYLAVANEKDRLVRETTQGESHLSPEQIDSKARRHAAQNLGYEAVFGPDTEGSSEHAGAFSPGDARILFFPVRSLAGVFAWTTSLDVLERFQREAQAARINLTEWPNLKELREQLSPPKDKDAQSSPVKALLSKNSAVEISGKVVLEEFTFDADLSKDEAITKLAKWIAQNAFPGPNGYFADKLKTSLVILDDESFRDFTQFSTEVVTRIKLDYETKTVEGGALWTEESLPTETLLYSPLMATLPRPGRNEKGELKSLPKKLERSGTSVIKFVKDHLDSKRLQLGGDETVGRGSVYLRFAEPQSLLNAATKA